jgi:hypothetical protein
LSTEAYGKNYESSFPTRFNRPYPLQRLRFPSIYNPRHRSSRVALHGVNPDRLREQLTRLISIPHDQLGHPMQDAPFHLPPLAHGFAESALALARSWAPTNVSMSLAQIAEADVFIADAELVGYNPIGGLSWGSRARYAPNDSNGRHHALSRDLGVPSVGTDSMTRIPGSATVNSLPSASRHRASVEGNPYAYVTRSKAGRHRSTARPG